MVEGAPLLREYRVKSSIEGSNPSLSARYDKGPNRGLCRIWRRERCGRNLRVRQIRQERIWTAERLARALCARVRLRDEPSISLSMLGWSSVRAFFVSDGERGVDETSGLIRAIPGPHPSGHRRWRCSLRHPAFAVTNSSGTNLDSPRSLGGRSHPAATTLSSIDQIKCQACIEPTMRTLRLIC